MREIKKDISEKDEFEEKICAPLAEQEKLLGENLKEYKICALCYSYIKRSEYNNHLQFVHHYTTFNVSFKSAKEIERWKK